VYTSEIGFLLTAISDGISGSPYTLMTFSPSCIAFLSSLLFGHWARPWGPEDLKVNEPVEKLFYLAWHSTAACKAGLIRRHRCRLPQWSFPLFSLTLELCCTKTRAHLRSSDSSPLPWFILPVITHFYSLVYSKLHRYIHPLLHHSPTQLLLLTLCWSPSCAVGCLDRAHSILPHASLDEIHKFLQATN